jgi:hypothetical protein
MALQEAAMVLVAHLVQAREVGTAPVPAEAVPKVCEALHLPAGMVRKAEVWVLVLFPALCLVR